MAETGKYIVIEGGEWMGKTTQSRLLAERMRAMLVCEPGFTPLGIRIRSLMIEDFEDVSPLTDALLVNTARSDTIDQVERAIMAGTDVVSDRNKLSTLAYQGYGQGVDLETLHSLCGIATRGIEPDITFVLDAPAHVIQERRADDDTDKFELENDGFHERVRHGYRELAKELGCLVVDASMSVDAVHDEIWARVNQIES